MGVEKPIVATLPPTHFPRGRNCKAIKSIDEMTFKKFSQSLAFCSLLLAAPAVFAATELVPPSAQLAFPLENQGGSARANAMGSAFVAVGGDVSALSWNPAGLASLTSAQLALHHNFYLQDLTQDTLLFATPQGDFGSWGLSASYLGYGSLQGRDSNGVVTGSYNAGRWGGEIAWAHVLFQGFAIGLGLKGNLLDLSGADYSNIAGDVGALWDVTSTFHVGASYDNWGTDISGNIANSVIRFGGAYDWAVSFNNQALLAGSLFLEPFGVARLNIGAEDVFNSFLSLRAGYVAGLSSTLLQGLTGLTAGLGLKLQDFNLDYAYSPFGDLGTSQRVSLTYHFEGAAPKTTPVPGSSTKSTQTKATPTPAKAIPVTVYATPPPGPTATPAPAEPKKDVEKLRLLFSLPENQNDSAGTSDLDWDQKVQADKDAIDKDAKNLSAWYELAMLYYQKGKKEDAIQCFEQTLRLKPDNEKLRNWLKKYKERQQ